MRASLVTSLSTLLRGAGFALATLAAGAGLAGCNLLADVYSDEIEQAEQKLEQLQVPEPPPLPVKKEEPKIKEEYKRPEMEVRRDPFIFQPPKPKADDEGAARELEPLEKFTIQQLKLVGIVSGTSVPKAMFVDPTGFGHLAKEGDRIGPDGGRISEIRDNEVEVTLNASASLGDNDLPRENTQGNEPAQLIIRLIDSEISAERETSESEDELLNKIRSGGGQPPADAPKAPSPDAPPPSNGP